MECEYHSSEMCLIFYIFRTKQYQSIRYLFAAVVR